MRKKLTTLLIILVIGITFSMQAQNQNKIDSLTRELNKTKDDSAKVKLYDALSNALIIAGDYKTALKYAEEHNESCEKLISITKDTAKLKYYKNEYLFSFSNLGTIYRQQGDYDAALRSFSEQLKFGKEFGIKGSTMSSYNSIAIVYNRQGIYSKALQYYFESLKIAEDIGDKIAISGCYNNIGIIYSKEANYSAALQNYSAALKIKEELGDKRGMANAYQNIGQNYDLQGQYPDALVHYKNSLKLRQEIGDKDGIAKSFGCIGTTYYNQKNNDEALKYHSSALKIQEDIGDKYGVASSYKNIGNDYAGTNQYSDAINYLNKSIQLATELGSKELLHQSFLSLSGLYEAKKDYKNALKFHKSYLEMKDSLFGEASNKQINELKTKYETEKKEKEIILLNKDNELQNAEIKKQTLLKNSFIGGLVLLCVLVFFGYRSYRTRQLLKLQTLRNKIASDLHDDVGSTLSSIAIFSEVAQQQSKEVIPLLNTIGESARRMLDAMADIVWTINPENDQFEKIILRMRSFAYELLGAKKIEFEFDADEDITNKKLPMNVRKNLYLIFKEATNNLAKYSDATKASITIKDDNHKLKMLIRDNGKGFDVTKEIIGNGLKNMKKRADEIGAKLLIESLPGEGTTINLLIDNL